MDRTSHAINNSIFAIINKSVLLLGPFIVKTCIISYLGSSYLGLSSLFTSILSILNLTEMGISGAVIYFLYKPLAENDVETVSALMNFYKYIYRILGIIILISGLCLLPFLGVFIKNKGDVDINIQVLFLIYLFNTVLSYMLFAYRTCILIANQRNDVISKISTLINIFLNLLQIFVLAVFKNYYLYVVLFPIATILTNILNAILSKKLYPQYEPCGKLSNAMISNIKIRVGGLFINKVCQNTRNSLDSIVLSSFIGLSAVGIYNNYYFVMSSITTVLYVFTESLSAGVGNSIAVESVEKNYKDFRRLDLMYMFVAGCCSVCLVVAFQDFMTLWTNGKMLLSNELMIMFCLYFFLLKCGDVRGMYYDGSGLWWYGRDRSIMETVLNLILNIGLGYLYGISGVLAATLISVFFVNYLWGTQITFKFYFKKGKKGYSIQHIKVFIVTIISSVLVYILFNYKINANLFYIVFECLCSSLIYMFIFVITFRHDMYFKDVLLLLKGLVFSKIRTKIKGKL